MNDVNLGISMISRLNSIESILECKTDPVLFVENAGGSVSHLDERSLHVLKNYISSLEVSEHTAGLSAFSLRCTGCKASLAFTIAGLTVAILAVIAFAIGGTAGADAPAAPAEAVAGAGVEMAVIAAETGLETAVAASTTIGVLESWVAWAAANKVAAAALAASGAAVEVLASDIIDALCERAGLCS